MAHDLFDLYFAAALSGAVSRPYGTFPPADMAKLAYEAAVEALKLREKHMAQRGTVPF